jgi:hypothetical protein
MKSTLHIFIAFITSNFIFSQENIVSSGNSITGPNGSASYTVGQIAYNYLSDSTTNISEGLQQPIEVITLSFDNFDVNANLIKVYPNPITDFITLSTETSFNGSYALYDLQGKLLEEKKITGVENRIDFQNLSIGVYILNVFSNTNLKKQFKIIKNN